MGSDSAENNTSDGHPAAAATCMGPVSLPNAATAPRASTTRSAIAVAPASERAAGQAARMAACPAASPPVPSRTGVIPAAASRRPTSANFSAGHRLAGRWGAARNHQGVAGGQAETPHVGRDPGQIGRLHRLDAGHAELLGLTVEGVHEVAPGVGVRVRASRRDARPLHSAAQQAKVPAAAVRGLQVVDAVETAVAQPPAQSPPARDLPRPRPVVDPDGVEPGAGGRELGEGPGGEQGDAVALVVAADGGEGAGGLDEVAERAELDDQDVPPAHTASTSAVPGGGLARTSA